MRGFRPLSRIAHPSLVNSYFLGGPSSVKIIFNIFKLFLFFFLFYLKKKMMIPVATGTALQPVFLPQLQQPTAGMAAFTGADHWKIERVVAVALLAIIPGSFVFDTAFMNYLLAASLAIHAHWGL